MAGRIRIRKVWMERKTQRFFSLKEGKHLDNNPQGQVSTGNLRENNCKVNIEDLFNN